MSENERAWIKSVQVTGLHGQIDINANFIPGINVIYGQNGVGKTTLIHIISNIINFDFVPFENLRFDEIYLEVCNGPDIRLKKVVGSIPEVSLGTSTTSVSENSPRGSEVERELFKKTFGRTPVYIPAFRNILEKIDSIENSASTWAIAASALRGKDRVKYAEEENPVSVKTRQCRQWFGEFTPIIRYPSVQEVKSQLIEYWRRAESASQKEENEQIDSAINSILARIFGQDPKVVKTVTERLLEHNKRHKISPIELAKALSGGLREDKKDPAPSPLDLATLYIDAIYASRERRAENFDKIDQFVSSINEFLNPDKQFVFPKNLGKNAPRIEFVGSDRHYGMATLSSGERQLLTLLFAAWSRPDESRVMLIDEPEISLHIDWQRIILREMSKQGNQQIIACTHSPEIAADLDEGYQMFDNFVVSKPAGSDSSGPIFDEDFLDEDGDSEND